MPTFSYRISTEFSIPNLGTAMYYSVYSVPLQSTVIARTNSGVVEAQDPAGIVTGIGTYYAQINYDPSWGQIAVQWDDGSGLHFAYEDEQPTVGIFADLLMSNQAAAGSTTSRVVSAEAYSASRRYAGNLLVWKGVATVITAYSDAGSGASYLDVYPSLPAAPSPGDPICVAVNMLPASDIAAAVVLALAGSISASVLSPVDAAGNTTVVCGDTYQDGVANPSLSYTITGYTGPAVSGATVRWGIVPKAAYDRYGTSAASLTVAGTAAQTGSTVTIKVPLSASNTASLSLHTHPPEPIENHVVFVQLLFSGAINTQVIAKGTVLKTLAPAP